MPKVQVYPAPEVRNKKSPFYVKKEFPVTLQLYKQTDINPSIWRPYGDMIKVIITATRIGDNVTLQLPGISLEISEPSFISVVDNLIPKSFRPTSMNVVSFVIPSYLTSNPPLNDSPQVGFYQGLVYRNGTFTIALPGGYPINPGQFITNTASVTYVVNPQTQWLNNYVVSTWGSSNAVSPAVNSFFTQPPTIFNFGDYEAIDMQNGIIATAWGDNSHTPPFLSDGEPGKVLNQAFSLLKLKENHEKTKVIQTIPPHYISPAPNNAQVEEDVAISFVNPNYIATASTNYPLPLSGLGTGLLYSLSTDGGKTFNTQMILTGVSPGPPPSLGLNKTIRWDRFNNLWITYLAPSPITGFLPFYAYTVGSPNGDPNKFRLIPGTEMAAIDPTATTGMDYPWCRTGPDVHETGAVDGGRPEALWAFAAQPNSTSGPGNPPLFVMGFRINGPLPNDVNAPLDGIVGPVKFYFPEVSGLGGYGDIGVGVNGDVFLTLQSEGYNSLFSSQNSQSTLFGLYNPKGLDGDFGTRRDIGQLSLGFNISITPSPRFILNPNAFFDLSNGPYRDRLYCVFVDQQKPLPGAGLGPEANPPYSNPAYGQIIMLTWSDDKGITWADPIQINNDIKDLNSNFNPDLAIDRSTGNLAVGFYTARCDPGNYKGCDTDGVRNTDVYWVLAVITTDFIAEVECNRKKSKKIYL